MRKNSHQPIMIDYANMFHTIAEDSKHAGPTSEKPKILTAETVKPTTRTEVLGQKLAGAIAHFFSAHPTLAEWEEEIAQRKDLVMHPRVSRLATSASGDGLILKSMPRIYAPKVPVSKDDMQAEDFADRLKTRDVFCVWHFGSDGVGHPSTVHGGAISMAFDESFGHAFLSLGMGMGFTAYLNTNFRAPLPTGNPTLVTVQIERIEGRKVFMTAMLTNGLGTHFADAKCLFILPADKSKTAVKA